MASVVFGDVNRTNTRFTRGAVISYSFFRMLRASVPLLPRDGFAIFRFKKDTSQTFVEKAARQTVEAIFLW